MKDLLNRFKSRKFILTVAGIVLVTLFPNHADQIIQLIGMFVGVEGAADVVERYRGRTVVSSSPVIPMSYNTESDDVVDQSKVVSGKPSPTPLFDQEPADD